MFANELSQAFAKWRLGAKLRSDPKLKVLPKFIQLTLDTFPAVAYYHGPPPYKAFLYAFLISLKGLSAAPSQILQ